MATIRTIRLISLIISILMVSEAYCQLVPWRPVKVPETVINKDINSVKQSIQSFTYNESDWDVLISSSILFPPDEATKLLKQYISAYGKKTSKRDLHWARIVFCFGLVNTEVAKEYLLKLWDKCDSDLASNKVKVPFSGDDENYNNFLAPVADALRFYMDDYNLQSWVYKRVEEINKIKQPSPVKDLNASCRRAARGHLVLALYTWLIVDSASTERNLSRLITNDYFFTHPSNIDYDISAKAVVNIASKLKDWNHDMPEKDWMKMRSQQTDSCLDDVAHRLGRPLAIAIWENYLGRNFNSSKVSKGSELRLWWIALQCYAMDIAQKKDKLLIDTKDEQFLSDACLYSEKLPKGYWANVCIEGLYAISCYFPDNQNIALQSIRNLTNRRLSEQQRQDILLRVQKN